MILKYRHLLGNTSFYFLIITKIYMNIQLDVLLASRWHQVPDKMSELGMESQDPGNFGLSLRKNLFTFIFHKRYAREWWRATKCRRSGIDQILRFSAPLSLKKEQHPYVRYRPFSSITCHSFLLFLLSSNLWESMIMYSSKSDCTILSGQLIRWFPLQFLQHEATK